MAEPTPLSPDLYRRIAAVTGRPIPEAVPEGGWEQARIRRLEQELAAKDAVIAARDETIRQLREEMTAIVGTVTNPYLTPTEKVVAIRVTATAKAKAHRGEVDAQGRVHLSACEVSGDWREKPTEGEALAKTNPDGTPFLLPRANVKKTAHTLRAADLLPVAFVPVTRQRRNGRRYEDTDMTLPAPASMADYLATVATYVPPEVKLRKDYVRREPCLHCGEVHPISRTDVCTGCGGIVAQRVIPVPLAQDPARREEARATLAATVTKNVPTRIPTPPDTPLTAPVRNGHKKCSRSTPAAAADRPSAQADPWGAGPLPPPVEEEALLDPLPWPGGPPAPPGSPGDDRWTR